VCNAQDVVVVGGSFNEQLSIQCEVAADPSDVKFLWMFNNSGENNKVAEDRIRNRNVTSTLSYTIISERDYGTLQCWGSNDIGRQLEPCVFQVVPAGKRHLHIALLSLALIKFRSTLFSAKLSFLVTRNFSLLITS
jgi:hypothetical protein